MGKLAQAEDVGVVLGPAMNIKRSPLCGRNFEYYSEDPLVSSKMAAGTVTGIQSQNVGTSPKHFLANNQEYYRMSSDSVVDERTLREIYLASFEGMVIEAKPWTIMCSYNRINGTYASENRKFLTDILKNEWGFEGCVLTDWGACNNPVDSLKAGLDLEMPGPVKCNERKIIEAVQTGELAGEDLDQAVEKILKVIFDYCDNHIEGASYDFDTGHKIAKKIAEESAVLLKNEDSILPIKESERVVIIGEYAKNPRYQGGGSSHVHPYHVTNAWECLKDRAGISYEKGFDDKLGKAYIKEAAAAAEHADKAVIFAGLPDSYESEGIDRNNLDLPVWQNELIEAVAAVQPNTIIVLHNGSPVAMPWIKSVKAVLEMYLGGEAAGEATADILYGKTNPCGHLAESFPVRIEDTPSYPYFGVERDKVYYREGVLTGYRYYETMKRNVLFPFGHGLSYTEFEYSGLKVEKDQMLDTETLQVDVTVKNKGMMAGKMLVQLYVGNPEMRQVVRPVRELRRFQKVYLEPGEVKTVTFQLNKRDFSYWNETIHDWYAATGIYKIQIGLSASEIVCEKEVKVISTNTVKPVYTVNSPMGDIMKHPAAAQILAQMIGAAGGNADQASSENEGEVISKEALAASAQMTTLRSMVYFVPDADIDQMQQLVDIINAQLQEE